MPYKSNTTLPDNVKNVLPAHAQDIYRAAINNAWEEYNDSKLRQEDNSREETAHKVAWGGEAELSQGPGRKR